jgi:hypothetical protein
MKARPPPPLSLSLSIIRLRPDAQIQSTRVAAPRQDPATTLLLLTISHRTGAAARGRGPLGEAQPLVALDVARQRAALSQPQAARW